MPGMGFPLAEILKRKRMFEALGGSTGSQDPQDNYDDNNVDPTDTMDDPESLDLTPFNPTAMSGNWQDFQMPENPYQKRLLSHLESMPTREQYKPSLGRKIGAALTAAAGAAGSGDVGRGVALGREITDSPYNHARDEWQLGAQSLNTAANLEGARINSGLSFGLRSEGNKLRGQDIQRKIEAAQQRHTDRMAELTARNASTAELHAETKRFHDESLAIQRGELAVKGAAEKRLGAHEAWQETQDRTKPVPASEQDKTETMANERAIRELKSSDPDFDETQYFDANGQLRPKPEASSWKPWGKSQQELDAVYDNVKATVEKHKRDIYNYRPRTRGGAATEEWTRDANGNLVKK